METGKTLRAKEIRDVQAAWESRRTWCGLKVFGSGTSILGFAVIEHFQKHTDMTSPKGTRHDANTDAET